MSRYRHDFALLHPTSSELLVLSSGADFVLPSARSDDWLHAKALLEALHSEIPVDAVLLRPARYWRMGTEDTMILYVLAVHTDTLPAKARWLGLEALRAGALDYPELGVLETILCEDAEPSLVPALRPDWARRVWLREVKAWLARELAHLGRVPVGEPEQLRHWGISAVLKQKTDAGEVYFKAVINHFIAEPRITAAVAELFPDLTPKVLALDAERG